MWKKWKNLRKQRKINKGIGLFLKGKHAKAKNIFKDFQDDRNGDVVAVKILLDEPESVSVEQFRNIYGGLWKAKDLGFANDGIKQAVESKLDVVTPVVMEHAREDILKIYKQYNNGEEEMLCGCREHVAYGHPDAIALQIWGYMKFGCKDEPKCYYPSSCLFTEWFNDLNTAKRRGISEEFNEHTETLMKQLLILIEPEIFPDPPEKWPVYDDPSSPTWWQ